MSPQMSHISLSRRKPPTRVQSGTFYRATRDDPHIYGHAAPHKLQPFQSAANATFERPKSLSSNCRLPSGSRSSYGWRTSWPFAVPRLRLEMKCIDMLLALLVVAVIKTLCVVCHTAPSVKCTARHNKLYNRVQRGAIKFKTHCIALWVGRWNWRTKI